MALIRFVNMITDKGQTKQYAKPVHIVAEEMGLPEWLVNVRHEATHTDMPSLRVLKTGVRYALLWLQLEYWEENSDVLNIDDSDEMREILINYQQEQFKLIKDPMTASQRSRRPIKAILDVIKEVLQSKRRQSLVQQLLQDGFLVPSLEQLQSLKITEDDFVYDSKHVEIPPSFCALWNPVLDLFDQSAFTDLLICSLLTELCKFTSQDVFAAKCLAGWTFKLIETVSSKGSGSGNTQSDAKFDGNWKRFFELCVDNPGRWTVSIMTRIMAYVRPRISPTVKNKLRKLASVFVSSEDDIKDEIKDACKSIFTSEDVLLHAKSNSDEIADKANYSINDNQTTNTECHLKDGALSWQLSSDAVDWSMYPLGLVPDQSMQDPQHLELPVSMEPLEQYGTDTEQCGTDMEQYGTDTEESEMECDDERDIQELINDNEAMVATFKAGWPPRELETFKENIKLW
ncbi:ribosomal biogenesis protein LAS1L-like isoform X2 [Ptychodera flava]